MTALQSDERFALCVRNDGYVASLEVRKIYHIVCEGDSETPGYVRIIDESGEDHLYPQNCFAVVRLSPEACHALSTS